MPKQAIQAKMIRVLYELDHAFIPKEQVFKLTDAFGFKGTTYLAKANPEDFKGLSLYDAKGNPVSEMEGQAAHKVALQIAKHLGVEVPDMYGIGSQLRVACAKILEHLNAKTTPQKVVSY